MISNMAEITKIENLNGKNYQSWKYNIKLVLMERGLWGFIAGTETAPAETATVQVKNAYRLRSDKAYSLIALSVDKAIQVHISTTTDPRVAWETLQKQFEFVSISQIVRLNRKFYAATMKEGTDILDHLTHMTSLAEQLRELKEDISDQKFATVVLGSLPESYEGFISSLNARKMEELNWNNIKGLLIEVYMKRKEKGEKQSEESGRNEALFSRRGNFSGRGRRRGVRYQGHNHRHDNRPRIDHGQGTKSIQQDGEIALNCTSTNNKKCDQRFIDSGATKHMTFQRYLIVDYIKYKQPSNIYLGDNRVIKAYGEGTVKLQCYDGADGITSIGIE